MSNRSLLLAGLAIASMALSGPGQAAAAGAASGVSADTLARNIASVVQGAEKAHKGPMDSLPSEVQQAVQNMISTAGLPPTTVKTALEQVLNVCVKPGAGDKQGLSCPADDGSFIALRSLLSIVNGLLKDAPGDVSNPSGPLQTLPLPISGGGGADYRQTP